VNEGKAGVASGRRISKMILARSRRADATLRIAAILALVIAVGASACTTSTAGGAAPGSGSIIDGFPLDGLMNPVPGADTEALGIRALDQRVPGHAAIVSSSAHREDMTNASIFPDQPVARSGTMTVYLFALADGSYHAAGVYCGVGGCRPWPVYQP
jgi:hypothetical protein